MTRAAIIALVLCACGASDKSAAVGRAEVALQAALAATDAAGKIILTGDQAAQDAIVAAAPSLEAGKKALLVYRAERDEVVQALVAAYISIANAAASLAAAELDKAVDPTPLVNQVAKDVAAVKAAVRAFRGPP